MDEETYGSALTPRDRFEGFTILEGPSGFVLQTVGSTPGVDQGDIANITRMDAAYTDGANTCTAFLAVLPDKKLYLGHSEGDQFTDAQRDVLQHSTSVIVGSGEASAKETILSQFPTINSIYEISKPLNSPQGRRPVLNLLVRPKSHEVVYDWGFVTDD